MGASPGPALNKVREAEAPKKNLLSPGANSKQPGFEISTAAVVY